MAVTPPSSAIGAVHRDERTVAVEQASFRLAYLCLSYGLLASVAYRSFVRHEQPWDLLALVVVGGVVSAGYQAAQGTLNRRWAAITATTVVAAALMAMLAAGLMR